LDQAGLLRGTFALEVFACLSQGCSLVSPQGATPNHFAGDYGFGGVPFGLTVS
jgi:hypothetical protein